MRTYIPQNTEIFEAVTKIQRLQREIGVRKLYQQIIDEHTEWKLSQKQFRSFFMQHFRNASPKDVKSQSEDDTEEYEMVEENFVFVDDLDSDCVLVDCVGAASF